MFPQDAGIRKTHGKAVAEPTARPTEQPDIVYGDGWVKGGATWYCEEGRSRCHHAYPDGPGSDFYAAAGPALRKALGKNWRGDIVTVWYKGKTVTVKLVDWCACGGDHIIDLYGDAFQELAGLGAGHLHVKITW